MIEVGDSTYLTDGQRIEGGDHEDRRIAFTSFFCLISDARQMRQEE